MKNNEKLIRYCIYIVLAIGLIVCVAVLIPQVRQMIIELAERIMHRKTSLHQEWTKTLLSFAMGGIFLIILLGYCLLTVSGKTLVHNLKNEVRDSLMEINWRAFTKPMLLMSSIYLLGILTIVRANFLYLDDVGRTISGYRGWYDWSRYIAEFLSIFIHADFHLTDISPLPQLIAILILAVSSVLLVYVLNNKRITITGLLASVPLGLSPYILECLSYKYDAPYMALSVLASIVPFLFLARKKVFVFISVISLLIMCMTYQASSGIYLLILLVVGFNDWNNKRKTNREVVSFLGISALSFGIALAIFKLFLMKPYSTYVSNEMIPLPQMLSGILFNFRIYVSTINSDFGFIWKTITGIIICFFIAKSVCASAQKKIISFLAATILLCLLFVLAYGIYIVLEHPHFPPRALYGLGAFLAIISIYVVSEFNKIAKIFALALSWSFFVFAFSYGNALADQARYANFRMTVLLHDLSNLYPDVDKNEMVIYMKNTIDYTPSVKNIAKHNPVIYKLVPPMMGDKLWSNYYFFGYFNYIPFKMDNLRVNIEANEMQLLDMPVVLKSYYHTIRSDEKRILVELNNITK